MKWYASWSSKSSLHSLQSASAPGYLNTSTDLQRGQLWHVHPPGPQDSQWFPWIPAQVLFVHLLLPNSRFSSLKLIFHESAFFTVKRCFSLWKKPGWRISGCSSHSTNPLHIMQTQGMIHFCNGQVYKILSRLSGVPLSVAGPASFRL